jgi:hypothetical protein
MYIGTPSLLASHHYNCSFYILSILLLRVLSPLLLFFVGDIVDGVNVIVVTIAVAVVIVVVAVVVVVVDDDVVVVINICK